MKSLASISLFFLFLVKGIFPNMDLSCELVKIPYLMEHYGEHRESYDNTFLQFLGEHYLNLGGNTQEHRNENSHDNLPFHGNTHCCHSSAFYAPEQHFLWATIGFAQEIIFIPHTAFHHSEPLDSLFQPPRV